MNSSQSSTLRCRKCGKPVRAFELVFSKEHNQMICNSCLSGKTPEQKQQEKPAGWDRDDDYIEKAYAMKKKPDMNVEKISDEKVKYTCQKCKYKYIFNVRTKFPDSCPYCGYKPIGI